MCLTDRSAPRHASPAILRTLRAVAKPVHASILPLSFDPGSRVEKTLQKPEIERADLIVTPVPPLYGTSLRPRRSPIERLILASPVPVLALGPRAVPARRLERILYSTDLGPDAESVFDDFLAFARSMNARITVFYAANIPAGAPVSRSARQWHRHVTHASSVWIRTWAEKHRQLESYIARAKNKGLAASAFLDVSGLRLSQALLSAATQDRADLIALPARGGPRHSILRGNTLRQVIQRAPCPVWVLRAQEKAPANAAAA